MSSDVLKDWVRTNAGRFPSAPALENIETGERYSWSELDVRVGKLAGVLTHRFGIGQGDRVLVLSEGDTRSFEIQFACMRLGAIMVPLNWRLALPELVTLATDAEPALVLFDGVWRESALKIAEAVGVTSTMGWRAGDDHPDYDVELDKAVPVEPRTDLPNTIPTHILHTSGTTGSPKGAITTAKTMTWQTFNAQPDGELTGPGAKQLNPMPLFHAGGLTTVAAPMLLTGGCVSTMRRFDAPLIAELMADPAYGITHFTAPPVMWLMLSEQPAFNDGDFSSLRFAQVAGGVPSLELVETWRAKGVVLQQAYGGTELGPLVTAMPKDAAARGDRPASCGKAAPFTHVKLVDPDGAEVEGRDVGEVWIKGPSVTPGYWRHDVANDASFVDGWFRTGDAAWCDEEGFYYLVDRYKDMFKSGGENVAPAEVERVIATHPDVAEVAVIGVPHPKWGEVGRAFVVLNPGASITLEDIEAHCGQSIARYKIPHSMVIVDSLPRNTTGKVTKALLRQQTITEPPA